MKIRKSTEADIEIIVQLRQKLWEFEKENADFDIRIPCSQTIYEEFISFYKNHDNKVILLLDDEGNTAGFIYGNIEKAAHYINGYQKTGYIGGIFVYKTYRGKGGGKLLIEGILDWFQSENIEFIQLGVLATNTGAMELYKKLGFNTYYCKMKKII